MKPKAIRPLYETCGADIYYREHADAYENPHFPEIAALIRNNFHRFDCSGLVLDFAGGGGEATQVLQQLGAAKISGCDPYTHNLYEKNTGLPCMRHSFRDVVRNGLPGAYTLIISSFALHLCPSKDLFPLAWNLLCAAPQLVVITPHKRPELELLPGIVLAWEDFMLTEKGKKVRMKSYKLLTEAHRLQVE